VKDNVLAQIALLTAGNPYELALREVMREDMKYPEINLMWARRVIRFGDPTEAYIYPFLDEKDGAVIPSSGHLIIGTRITSHICGQSAA